MIFNLCGNLKNQPMCEGLDDGGGGLWNCRDDQSMFLNEFIYVDGRWVDCIRGNNLRLFEKGYREGYQQGQNKINNRATIKEKDLMLIRTSLSIFDQGYKRGYDDGVKGIGYQL